MITGHSDYFGQMYVVVCLRIEFFYLYIYMSIYNNVDNVMTCVFSRKVSVRQQGWTPWFRNPNQLFCFAYMA